MADRGVSDLMVANGRALRLETTGRTTGRRTTAVIGFVDDADGSLLVAAGDPDADWAANLDVDPRCRVTMAGVTRPFLAQRLDVPDHARAVRELILRYGTPSERLGSGPSYRLRPVEDPRSAAP